MRRLHLTYLLENSSNDLIKMGDIAAKPLMLIVISGLQDDTGLTQKHFIILKIVSVSSNKYRDKYSHVTITEISYLLVHLFHDLVKPPCSDIRNTKLNGNTRFALVSESAKGYVPVLFKRVV